METIEIVQGLQSYSLEDDVNQKCKASNCVDNQPCEVITLGNLYAKDLPDGFFLPERPSTFHPRAKFLNDERYIIHDLPPWTSHFTEYLKPIQVCLVAGNDLPMLLRHQPKEELLEHWKQWLPFFPQADLRDLVTQDSGDSKLITLYPLQSLPKEKHAHDPDMHYEVLSKNSIPDMGANSPHHMSTRDYTVPCMIKVTHGHSGKGTYMAKTRKEAEKIISHIRDEVQCPEPSITEVIDDITGNYCAQFYLSKSGNIKWLGVAVQAVDKEFHWNGGYADWNEQTALKKKVYSTVMPVKEYLHKKGYFGIVGVDVLASKSGNYVVDVNPRINGSTTLLLIAPHMAAQGYPISALLQIPDVRGSEVEMMKMFDKINNSGKGIVINLASVESSDGSSCEGHVCMFAKDEEGFKDLHDNIISQ